MRRLPRYALSVLLLVSLCASLQAQPVVQRGEGPVPFDTAQARFEHFTVADGLPSSSIRAMLQDHLGFLWFGTHNGLVRYDGQAMTVFQPEPDDPHSFGGRFIHTLYEDRVGDLWIGTALHGLVHYDRATGRFTSYRHDPADSTSLSGERVLQIHEDRAGDLWVVTGDLTLDRLNRATDSFTRFRHDPNNSGSLSHDRVEFSRIGKFIAALFEDRAGTLWVGTAGGGLNRFDPETDTFTHYRHEPGDPLSLSHDRVSQIMEDRAGQLWVPTWGGGLNRFDRQSETFTHYRHDPDDPLSLVSDRVFATYEDRLGALWVTTQRGLDRFDPETETFAHFPPDPDRAGSPSHRVLLPVHEDEAGLWFFTDAGGQPYSDGLEYYDRATGTFTHLKHDPNDPGSLNPRVLSLLKDRSGTLWVGNHNFGLHKLDRTVRFPLFAHDPNDPNSLSHNIIRALYEAPSEPGVLWIGTWGGGLDRFDQATGRFTHYRHDPQDPSSLSADGIFAIFEDHAQRLWVGTTHGLNLMDRRSGTFTRYKHNPADPNSLIWDVVLAIHETQDGALWIGSTQGLDRFDPVTQTFTHYTVAADTMYHPDLYRAVEALATKERRVASILHVGGNAVERTQPFAVEEPTEVLILGLGEFNVSTTEANDYGWIEDDAGEVVWRMTWEESRHAGGTSRNRIQAALMRLEPGSYQLRYQSAEGYGYGAWNFPVPDYPELWGIQILRVTAAEADTLTALLQQTDENRLSGGGGYALYEDSEGLLWIGTDRGGLNRFDPTTETFTAYFDPLTGPSSAIFIHEDQTGRLWLGDHRTGLHLIDREKGSIKRYTIADGLPSNGMKDILEDDEGFLWLSTDNGLSRFDPEAETFRNYNTAHGLQGAQFNRHAAQKSADGTLFFAGMNGFNAIDPSRLTDDPNPPDVVLTGFDLFNAPAAIGPEAPLQTDISVAEQITLAYDQNDFTVHFAALHYKRPEENIVAYKLEPYEETWVEGGLVRSARYTNLSPGSYTFRVKAANSDGLWNEEGRSIRITIAPPWWRTTWAYLFYGLLFVAGIVTVDRIQRRRLIRTEQEKARIRAAEERAEVLAELDELKTRFFVNVSHEFRTPLTLLLGPLQDALDGKDPHRLVQQAPLMHRNANRLLRLINQLLDLSRLEAGGMQLRARKTDLVAFLRGLTLAFTSRAEREGLTLLFDTTEQDLWGYVDRDKLEKIILNLLSNAFKFTAAGGKIHLELQAESKAGSPWCVITLTDTGQGIPPEELPHVFNRFHQVDDSTTRSHEGTGIGLALTRELVRLHGGTIEVESKVGFGATFTVRLPQGTEHLKPGDIVSEDEIEEQVPPRPDVGEPAPDPVPVEAEGEPPEPRAVLLDNAPTVLIVEDNADMRAYLKGHLETHYRVVETSDGQAGLEAARTIKPDLVLSDVMMPRMDGYALCRALKAEASLSHIPVVLLTARADDESRLEGLGLGADDYLTKPFNAEELLVRVENLIEIRRHLRARFSSEVRVGPREIIVPAAEAVFLERVRVVVEDRLADSTFGVEILADEVGLSKRQLQRKLRASTQLSVAGYIRSMRLERAAQLLHQRAGTVSEVAYKVGFRSVDHFSKLFRQIYGVPPSQYPTDETKAPHK